MDYYEELGLTVSASPDEIRQAYKSLARLLHPDQQKDAPLRRLAELQMKRLNAIHAVLSDPVKRRAYDLSLETGTEMSLAPVRPPGPPLSGWRRWLRQAPSDVRVALGLAGVTLLAGGLYWIFTADSKPRTPVSSGAWTPQAEAGAPAASASPERPADRGNPLTRELDHLRRRVQALEMERDAARAQAAELRARAQPGPGWTTPSASPASGAAALPEPPTVSGGGPPVDVTAAPRIPAPSPPPAAEPGRPRSGAARLAGTWFYAPPRLATSAKALYPPEYIEATIVEQDGLLRGRYYGRYRVSDRAISPEVIFYFEGRSQPDSAVLEWKGGGGARGEIRLKLLAENSLEVNWSATELGSTPGLAAGTAVLVRRVE